MWPLNTTVYCLYVCLLASEEWDILPVVSQEQGVVDTSLLDNWSTGAVWTSQLTERTPDTKVYTSCWSINSKFILKYMYMHVWETLESS